MQRAYLKDLVYFQELVSKVRLDYLHREALPISPLYKGAGKDTGKTGTLSKFISETKCIVSGVKIVKKHQKPNPQLNIQGGILEKESPIDVSNLAIYNKKSKKADKINIEIKKEKKIRVFKSDGKEIK